MLLFNKNLTIQMLLFNKKPYYLNGHNAAIQRKPFYLNEPEMKLFIENQVFNLRLRAFFCWIKNK